MTRRRSLAYRDIRPIDKRDFTKTIQSHYESFSVE